jgi:hypothetical protein
VKPQATDVLARAVAAIGAESAWPLLCERLRDPATPMHALKDIALALRDLKARKAVPALREFLFMYRADPAFASDPAALEAVAEALGALGSQRDRQMLQYVAEEPRTLDKLATYVRNELEQTRKKPAAEGARDRTAPAAAGGKTTDKPAEKVQGSPGE